jgi:hypothetical protein
MKKITTRKIPRKKLKAKLKYQVIALAMGVVSISETSINFYRTTRSNNPEGSHHLMLSGYSLHVQ